MDASEIILSMLKDTRQEGKEGRRRILEKLDGIDKTLENHELRIKGQEERKCPIIQPTVQEPTTWKGVVARWGAGLVAFALVITAIVMIVGIVLGGWNPFGP